MRTILPLMWRIFCCVCSVCWRHIGLAFVRTSRGRYSSYRHQSSTESVHFPICVLR